jgi:hypothetical protein
VVNLDGGPESELEPDCSGHWVDSDVPFLKISAQDTLDRSAQACATDPEDFKCLPVYMKTANGARLVVEGFTHTDFSDRGLRGAAQVYAEIYEKVISFIESGN